MRTVASHSNDPTQVPAPPPTSAHDDALVLVQRGALHPHNDYAWVDWKAARDSEVLTEFTARVAALRAAHPVFRRQRFFQSRPIRGSGVGDIAWLRPDGQQMSDDDWNGGHAQSLAIFLNGRAIPDRDPVGERLLTLGHHTRSRSTAIPTPSV